MSQQLSTNTFGVAKWIVSATASDGTHTTIGAALTSASSGDTIFIRPGSYTENLTLKAGVNLSAFPCDAYTADGNTTAANVIILGKCSATFAGNCSLSGINLKTNSDFCLSVTGSSATTIELKSCYIDANNNTAIQFTSSSGSSKIELYDCRGDMDTTGISYFTHSGAGALKFWSGVYSNNGASSTAATCSGGGTVEIRNSYWNCPVTTSSTSGFIMQFCDCEQPLIINGTGSSSILNSNVVGATNSAISIGTGAICSVVNCGINSSNTNAITGAGTLQIGGTIFTSSSSTINTTTVTGLPLSTKQGGTSLTASGTAGNLLKSDGTNWTSSTPQSVGASLILISQQVASSSASIAFTLNSSYITYKLIFRELTMSVGSATLQIQVSTNGGSTYISTNYQSNLFRISNGATTWANTGSASGLLIGFQTTSQGMIGEVLLSSVEESGQPATSGQTITANQLQLIQGQYISTALTANAFQIIPSSGTFTGTFTLYGVIGA